MSKCVFCSKILKCRNSKYCSTHCQQNYNWVERKKKFELDGFWEGVNSETVISRHSKRYLKETRGIQCEICSLTKWMGQDIPLVIDHIDGDSSNSNLDNLRLVCGNCDMQLPTYKSKNKGNGRYARKLRYKEGKSY